jgi:SAM-dependent methyltransferase
MHKCIVCHNNYGRTIYRNNYKHRQCTVCGATRLILEKYSSKDRKAIYDDLYWINNIDDAQRNSMQAIGNWIECLSRWSNIPINTILDFGTGRGYFIDRAAKLGFSCLGVDIAKPNRTMVNPSSIAITNKLTLIPTSSFDAVIAIESFQHLVWPHYYMAEFSRIVKDGGCIIIITSLSDGYLTSMEDWFYINPPYHSMLYTIQALKFIGDDCGMDMVWTDNCSITVFRSRKKNEEFSMYYDMIKNIDAT